MPAPLASRIVSIMSLTSCCVGALASSSRVSSRARSRRTGWPMVAIFRRAISGKLRQPPAHRHERLRGHPLALATPSVPDRDNRQLDFAARPPKSDRVALAALEERAAEGRSPGDVALVEIDLVFADDPVRRPSARLVLDLDVGAEERRRRAVG